MKKTLKKLLKRNIAYNFKQFLFVVFIVFLSMTLLSGFFVNAKTLSSSVDRYFSETNLADLWVYVKNMTNEDEQFLKDNNLKYEKRLKFEAKASINDGDLSKNSEVFVYDTGNVSSPYVYSTIDGCWIDKNVAKNNNIKVGQDVLSVDYNFSTLVDGNLITQTIKLQFLITGTMCLGECADTFSSWPFMVEKNVFLSEVNRKLDGVLSDITLESVPYNQLLIDTDDTESVKTLLTNYFSEEQNSRLLMLHGQELVSSVILLKDEVSQAEKMVYVFPIIFLIVSLLVIVTTIGQLILQEKTKIGALKSLGATNKMLLKHYSSYGFVLCLLGALAGIVVGPLLIPEIMFIKYDLIYSFPQEFVSLNFPFFTILLAVFVVVMLGYLTAFLSCRNLICKKPAWLLKPDVKINIKSKQKKKNSKTPLCIKMALRNLRIKPFRTVMAGIGVAGCVALLLCGYGIQDTLNHSLDNDLKDLFCYDITAEYKTNDFLQKLEDIDGVEYFETYQTYAAEISSETAKKTVTVYNICENSKFMSEKLASGEVMLSRSIAKELGKNAGDEISISFGGQIKNIKISKLVDTAFLNGIYIAGDFGGSELISKNVWIAASGNLDEFVLKINQATGKESAQTMGQIRSSAEDKISSISLMTATLKVFAILLAVVVLLNLIFLILKERIREIATLKVLGTGAIQIAMSICFEIVFISGFGMLFGMLLGFPLLILVLSINKVVVVNFLYHISVLSFVYTILLVAVMILATSLICILKVKNVNVIKELKSLE